MDFREKVASFLETPGSTLQAVFSKRGNQRVVEFLWQGDAVIVKVSSHHPRWGLKSEEFALSDFDSKIAPLLAEWKEKGFVLE